MFFPDQNIVEAWTIGMRRMSKHGSAFKERHMADYNPSINGAMWSTHISDAYMFENKEDVKGAMDYLNRHGREVHCTLQTSEPEYEVVDN